MNKLFLTALFTLLPLAGAQTAHTPQEQQTCQPAAGQPQTDCQSQPGKRAPQQATQQSRQPTINRANQDQQGAAPQQQRADTPVQQQNSPHNQQQRLNPGQQQSVMPMQKRQQQRVDVYMDGQLVLNNVTIQDAQTIRLRTAGPHRLIVVPHGAGLNGTHLASRTYQAEGHHTTLQLSFGNGFTLQLR